MRKRFGIDIDGTVTSPSAIIPYMNRDFKLNITLEDITQYDLSPFVNVPVEEFAKWFKQNEPRIYEESPLAEGAFQILKNWEKDHELYFISARGIHLFDVTKKWFQSQELNYQHLELIGSHDKVETAKRHNVDIFFEDKHDNAVMIHEECKIPVILFDTPYNRDPIPDGVIRVKNWLEAKNWVEKWINTP